MDKSKGLSQPLAAFLIKGWKGSGEIHLVFGAQVPGFVEQLNFWRKIGNAIPREPSQRRDRTRDLCRATKGPLVTRGVYDQAKKAAASLPPQAEAGGSALHQLIDRCASIDLNGWELQSRSLSCHLFCVERITRK